jgi:DNA-binding PadR family transcriptional regulator
VPKLPTTEYAILGLVAHRESSGYDLAQAAARGIGYIWAPSRSQIYKVLRRLEERGLVARREVAQRGKPDKALYRVTAGGRKALVEWIEDVADEPTGGPSVFLLQDPLRLGRAAYCRPGPARRVQAASRAGGRALRGARPSAAA